MSEKIRKVTEDELNLVLGFSWKTWVRDKYLDEAVKEFLASGEVVVELLYPENKLENPFRLSYEIVHEWIKKNNYSGIIKVSNKKAKLWLIRIDKPSGWVTYEPRSSQPT